MSTTPAGWYDDGHGVLRWWDGEQWTEHVHTPDPAPVADPAPAPAAEPVAPGAAPAPAPKSRLWIVWVVLGAALLVFVALVIVLIVVVSGFARSGGSVAATGDAQSAAVAAVERYDDAWQDADCDDYEASTTLAYRQSVGLEDCASFEDEATAFSGWSDEYDVAVTGIEEQADGSIVVTTLETYLSDYDANGDPLDEPVQAADRYSYTVVDDGGAWLIDALETVD